MEDEPFDYSEEAFVYDGPVSLLRFCIEHITPLVVRGTVRLRFRLVDSCSLSSGRALRRRAGSGYLSQHSSMTI
jgi:hypothetical protein